MKVSQKQQSDPIVSDIGLKVVIEFGHLHYFSQEIQSISSVADYGAIELCVYQGI